MLPTPPPHLHHIPRSIYLLICPRQSQIRGPVTLTPFPTSPPDLPHSLPYAGYLFSQMAHTACTCGLTNPPFHHHQAPDLSSTTFALMSILYCSLSSSRTPHLLLYFQLGRNSELLPAA